MTDVLVHPGLDRPMSPQDLVEALYRLHGNRGVLADTRRDRMACTFIVALCDLDDKYAGAVLDPNQQAEREWHQRDHELTGFGMGNTLDESHAEAVACARRGNLARYGLTVWFDRGAAPDYVPRFWIFRRARRRPPHYRPKGPELTSAELRTILTLH